MREGRARVGFEASLLAKLETCSRKPVLTNRELLLPMRVVVWGEQGVGGAPTIAVPICRRVVVGGRSRTVTEVRRDLGHRPAAAERAGRRCRGVELDPLYVDVILHRYELVTGRPAVLEGTGETYAELALRRQADAQDRAVPQSPSENAHQLQLAGK